MWLFTKTFHAFFDYSISKVRKVPAAVSLAPTGVLLSATNSINAASRVV